MNKIIILEHEPLTPTLKKNFLIDDFIEAGFKIEYWDISVIVHEDIALADQLKEDFIKKVETVEQFEKLIASEDQKSTIYIVEIFEKYSSAILFKILSKYQCYCIRITLFAAAVLPIPLKDKLVYLSSFRSLKQMIRNRFQAFYLKAFYKKNKISKFKLEFSSAKGVSSANEVIPINNIDVEKYMETLHSPRMIPNKYCVFLDEYLPFHPDLKYLAKIKHVNAKKYFGLMNNLFQRIEDKFGVEVVIAAHPKSDYGEDAFKGRKLMKYKTSCLVKHCEFIIAHHSLSINYAVLNYKPAIFTFSKEMRRNSLIGTLIINFRSKALNMPVYCLDDLKDIEICKVDKKKYDAYKYQFLTAPEIEHQSNKEIIINKLKAIQIQ